LCAVCYAALCTGRAKNDEAKSRDTPDVIRDVDGARKTAAATASGDKLSDVVKGNYSKLAVITVDHSVPLMCFFVTMAST